MQLAHTEITAIRQTIDLNTPLPAVVDELAEIQTLIAVLEAKEKNLKALLIASGLSEICGTSIRAKVCEVSATMTTDYRSLCDYLKPDSATVALFGKVKSGYTAVKLYGFN